MAINDELMIFVKDGLTRGVTRGDLEAVLITAGWPLADARAALGSFADGGLTIPVPRPRPNLSARDAFLYLVLFSTLYVVAFNLGSLLFDLINQWVPDPGWNPPADYLARAIRWSVSALVVATPVFLGVSALTHREVCRDPVKRASKVRRWLTYMTLFLAAAAVIGDVTALVYNLLGGELTTRFVLKAVVVAAIAGTIFLYYQTDVRTDEAAAGGAS